jgi:hypothetical protein
VIVPLEVTMPKTRSAVQAVLERLASNPAFQPMFMGMPPMEWARTMMLDEMVSAIAVMDHDRAKAQWENEEMFAGRACEPEVFYDLATHVEEHNRACSTLAYYYADLAVQEVFDSHVDAHYAILGMPTPEELAEQAQMLRAQQQAFEEQAMAAGIPPQMLGAGAGAPGQGPPPAGGGEPLPEGEVSMEGVPG